MNAWVAAVHAHDIVLHPRMSTAEALHDVALGCLHHIAANEPAVRAHDGEGVHQMRVGLRRLRAALAVFSDLLDDAESTHVKAELKWLTGELSPARDLDVYVTGNIKPLQSSLPDGRGLDALRHDLEARRTGSFRRARRAIESPRYRMLLLDVLAWIEGGLWTTTDDALIAALRRRKASDFARDELARRVEKVTRKAAKLAKLDPRQRHKLRMAIKTLRYAAKFFAGLFDRPKARKRLHRFERQLERLQDSLGALNDITVHERLAEKVVGRNGRRRQRAFAIGVVSGREQSRIAPLRAAAEQAAGRFGDVRPFWR